MSQAALVPLGASHLEFACCLASLLEFEWPLGVRFGTGRSPALLGDLLAREFAGGYVVQDGPGTLYGIVGFSGYDPHAQVASIEAVAWPTEGARAAVRAVVPEVLDEGFTRYQLRRVLHEHLEPGGSLVLDAVPDGWERLVTIASYVDLPRSQRDLVTLGRTSATVGAS